MATLTLPQKPDHKHYWGHLTHTHLAFTLAQAAQQHPGLLVVFTANMQQAHALQEDIPFFLARSLPVYTFPDWETLAYDQFSPHQDIISERLKILSRLPSLSEGVLIVPIRTALHRLTPARFLSAHSLQLRVGEVLDLNLARKRFEQAGYTCVNQVLSRGEFAVRGSILDVFPMGSDSPFRIDLFGDEVDSIRVFDPETQRSQAPQNVIDLLPAHEFPLTPEAISRFKGAWQAHFEQTHAPLLKAVLQHHAPPGIEYYLPLFFEDTATLFDYLPASALLAQVHNTQTQAEQFWQEVTQRYEQYRYDSERPILSPTQLFIASDKWFEAAKAFPQLIIQAESLTKSGAGRLNFNHKPLPDIRISPQAPLPLGALQKLLASTADRVLFCAESSGRREIMLEHLYKISVRPQKFDKFSDFFTARAQFGIAVAPLESSVWLEAEKILIITEHSLFSERVPQARRRKASKVQDNKGIQLRDLTELTPGAAVVHLEHGVGRYLGLSTLNLEGQNNEFITLTYADEAKLYVPISSIHLLSRYSGTDIEQAPLHRLGTDKWSKEKQKAAQKIRDVAAELLDIYAKRAAKQGFACEPPNQDYQLFTAGFPFEETPDQATAIDAVINDMCSAQPMDRLLCGDVGFGKTEVAMRAAFLAVQNGKQVAILVPTTLLAQQHYENFSDRFADWPVHIEVLSRFKTAKEQTAALLKLKDGHIDIIIGTHKLLGKDIGFARLGLLIVDEEHRFGVRHKEQIKALRAEVDILTMTATPIPRTLNMSLSHIRDLSIIATPPAKRLSVKTFVQESKKPQIKEAILREILRGGQVYFLHNSVDTIYQTAEELQSLLPELSIGVAHGQMRERELEKVMADFYHNRYNLLLCTTIIETGIDVPNANTIIIDRADKLGLAQLHQLRGRVGRSHHQAYAYLFTPPWNTLTTDAKKRLEALSSADTLGAGFVLASHDLEIRGSGELLGEEQSGNMTTIGFSLYMDILDRTVKAMKAGKSLDLNKNLLPQGCEVELRVSALIPEDYVPDVQMRLSFYQRIAAADNDSQLDDLQVELIDRFGLLPPSAKHLFTGAHLRLEGDRLGIKKIEAHATGGKIEFSDTPNIQPITLIRLVQVHPKTYQLAGPNKLTIKGEFSQAEPRIAGMQLALNKLAAK